MIVFGGFIGGTQAYYSNKVLSYNLEENAWKILWKVTKENKVVSPKARSNAGVVIVGNKLFMYGGSNGKQIFDDFWNFDLINKIW